MLYRESGYVYDLKKKSIFMLKAIGLLFFVPRENKVLTKFCYHYWSSASDNASPECNLTLSCAYFMAEVAMSIRKVNPLSSLVDQLLICIKCHQLFV